MSQKDRVEIIESRKVMKQSRSLVVTIPPSICEKLVIGEGDYLAFMYSGEGDMAAIKDVKKIRPEKIDPKSRNIILFYELWEEFLRIYVELHSLFDAIATGKHSQTDYEKLIQERKNRAQEIYVTLLDLRGKSVERLPDSILQFFDLVSMDIFLMMKTLAREEDKFRFEAIVEEIKSIKIREEHLKKMLKKLEDRTNEGKIDEQVIHEIKYQFVDELRHVKELIRILEDLLCKSKTQGE